MKVVHAAYFLARILLGSLFVYAGIIHLSDPDGFSKAVSAYGILPSWFVSPFSIALPWVELISGLMLATGIFVRAGSLITSILLVAFSIALAVSLYRGVDISCGCFSTSPGAEKISLLDLSRDIGLLLASVFVFLRSCLPGRAAFRPSLGTYLIPPLLTAALVGGLFLYQFHTRNPCEQVSLESISRHKSFPSPVILAKRPVGGLCEVMMQTGGKKVPVYAGKDFIIVGEMIREKKSVTVEGFMQVISKTFFSLRDDLDRSIAIRYVPRNGIRHTLYMFASPGCPNCEEALLELRPGLDETQTELRMLLVAQGSSQALAIKALCRPMDLDAYLAGEWMRSPVNSQDKCEKGREALKRSADLADKLGITNVPTFISEQGIIMISPQVKQVIQYLKG